MPRINRVALRKHLESLPFPGNTKFVSTIPVDEYVARSYYRRVKQIAELNMLAHDSLPPRVRQHDIKQEIVR